MQKPEQVVSTQAERYLLLYMLGVLIIICGLIVVFFTIFQRRKNQLVVEGYKQKQAFEEELGRTQLEIQEQTLKYIGRELHDNIGQLLVVATMQMNTVAKKVNDDVKPKVANASEALKEGLEGVRTLSRSLNGDVITNKGFDATLKNEINRLNKYELIDAHLNIEGQKVDFENQKDEVILFRIIQEFFSNTLKYAEAEQLKVHVDYDAKALHIRVEDNGIGFNLKDVEQGSGMTNMKKRAEFINAQFDLNSQPNEGTVLTLIYPYRTVV